MSKKSKKQKIIIGNWKMNPYFLEDAKKIFKGVKKIAEKLDHVTTIVCPPFVYIQPLKTLSRGEKVKLGAQDAFSAPNGSYTGEISPNMLVSVGVSHVILGHSERRKMGETDDFISKKLHASLDAGLVVILCVGEEIRDEQGIYLQTLADQLKNSLGKIAKKTLKQIVIAYEPVWAIGAIEAMSSRDIHETSIYIKKVIADLYDPAEALKVPVLYGGAVNPRNAEEIIRDGEVDGLLIGRESLNPPGFVEILKIANGL